MQLPRVVRTSNLVLILGRDISLLSVGFGGGERGARLC